MSGRTTFDQFFKEIALGLLEPRGRALAEYDVTSEPQSVDLYFEPAPGAGTRLKRELGLFGRIASKPCLLEAFHEPPDADEVFSCVRKQLAIHHRAVLDVRARKLPSRSAKVPPLWLLCGGRPRAVLKGLSLSKARGWMSGIYTSKVPWTPVYVVVISELPVTPETLVLRLFGAGRTLSNALAEVRTLAPDSSVARVAAEVSQRLYLSLKQKTGADLSGEERSFMVATKAEFEAWQKSNVVQGVHLTIRNVYKVRFGPMPQLLAEKLSVVTDSATLDRLTALVATGTSADFERALTPHS
jgi:hypothetical protein